MRKANATVKALLVLSLVFSLIAAASFAAFRETKSLCSEAPKCNRTAPANRNGGGMLWDDVARHFLSSVNVR